jgi:hypothetical protein
MADDDFEFSCPACGGRLLGSAPDVGQTMQCSYCSGTLTVPPPESTPAVSAPQVMPPPAPYATAPPPPPAWAYPPQPQYGAPAYGAAPYGSNPYAPPGYNPGPYAYPSPAPGRRNIWPLVIVLGVVGLLVAVGVAVAIANRVPRASMVARWSLTRSATGRLASARMDLNDDGTFNYHCTYANGRSARANGSWELRNRRLVLTVRSNRSISPFGNTTVLPWDVREVNGSTLHLHVKEGEQYWKHL